MRQDDWRDLLFSLHLLHEGVEHAAEQSEICRGGFLCRGHGHLMTRSSLLSGLHQGRKEVGGIGKLRKVVHPGWMV